MRINQYKPGTLVDFFEEYYGPVKLGLIVKKSVRKETNPLSKRKKVVYYYTVYSDSKYYFINSFCILGVKSK